MNVKIIYPIPKKRTVQRKKWLRILRYPLMGAAAVCAVVNLCVGGKPWALLVALSLYTLWTMILAPDLVEYNRISQEIKGLLLVGILLIAIDYFFAPGWAIRVVPLVVFGGTVTVAALFFSDLRRQKQNMFPMLLLTFGTVVALVLAVSFWKEAGTSWQFLVMGFSALALLAACMFTMGGAFLRELKKRFCTK